MTNKIFKTIVIVIICLIMLTGCDNVKFNNLVNKNDLLTKTYSNSQMDNLKKLVEHNTITITDFKKLFDIQCARKTYQGFYVVLLLENGENAFIFFNNENQLNHIIIANDFKSKNQFESQSLQNKTKSEILYLDENAILLPISAVDVSVHIVQEGICIVKYSRMVDGKLVDDPIFCSVEFIANDNIEKSDYMLIRNNTPFIYDYDKQNS